MKEDEAFIDSLILAFPEIKEEVLDDDYKGLFGLQIACLRRFTQKAIDSNDLNTVSKSFKFVDYNLDKVTFKIQNTLVIAYLEKLELEKGGSAERLLPPKLQEILKQFD